MTKHVSKIRRSVNLAVLTFFWDRLDKREKVIQNLQRKTIDQDFFVEFLAYNET